MTLPDTWTTSSRSGGNGCVEARWRQSSHCDSGACLEVAWQTSNYSSDSANCVEAALRTGHVLVRDSKLGDASPVLAFDPGTWTGFVNALKAGAHRG